MDTSTVFESLATRFPVCMASDEFHFFPQAKAKAFDWSAWDDFSPDSVAETVFLLTKWEKQIDRDLTWGVAFDQEVDAAMLVRVLRTLRDQFQLVRTHEIQPTFYLTIFGIGLAEALEAGPRALENRLKNMSGFIDQAIENLISVPRLFRDLGLEMLQKQQVWLASLPLPDANGTTAHDALRRLSHHLSQVDTVENFLPDIELYERIAREHMGCDLTPGDIARELEMEIEETRSILTRSAAVVSSVLSWETVIDGLPRPPLPPGSVLEIFRKTITELSRHCLSHGFVSRELVEQCPVRVEPIPDYMRPVRSNAAYSMPPVHPPRGGTFFLQAASDAGSIPVDHRLLTAHETFPGHHLLDTVRWSQERAARRHVEFPIFYEGWASFAEELMFDTGFFSGPTDHMLMARRRFWRAIRGQADFDIHMGRRTLDQTADFMVSNGMPPHRTSAMVRRYILKPGYQLAYTLGRRRFRELYDTAHPKLKDPAAFARRVLSLGEIGFHHLEHLLRKGG